MTCEIVNANNIPTRPIDLQNLKSYIIAIHQFVIQLPQFVLTKAVPLCSRKNCHNL